MKRGFATVSAVLLVAGCKYGSEFELPPPSTTRLPIESDAPYYDKVNDIGFALLCEMDTTRNVVFSPVAISHNLAMLMHGSSGKARDELLLALDLTESNKDEFNESQRALLNRMNEVDGRPVMTGSGVFAVLPVVFDKGYVEDMGKTYEGVVKKLGGATIEGRRLLNQWVVERVGVGFGNLDFVLSKDQDLVAVSVSRVQLRWDHATDSSDPTDHGQFRDETVSAVRMPLPNGAFFVAIMPGLKSSLAELIHSLDTERFGELLSKMTEAFLGIYVPKFACVSDIDLKPALESIGIRSLFDFDCNLRPMSIEMESGHRISKFMNRAGIHLDSNSTTKWSGASSGVPQLVIAPFVFAIVDEQTGVILTLGVVQVS